MGCPKGMSSIRHTRSVFTRPLIFGPIFLKVFLERYCNGSRVGCNNDRLFPEKYSEVLFLPEKRA